jgi:PKD repeat protein
MTQQKKSIMIAMIGFLNLISAVSIAQNLSATFNTNQTSGCAPLTIQFANTSVSASTYYWDFGNGNTSVLTNPSNVYSNAGVYTVKLIAIGTNGQKDSIITNNLITISSNSIPNFHALSTNSCLNGNSFSFINTSVNATSCLWDFGDGNTTTIQNPTHTYVSVGNYTIKLITYDSYGCPTLKIMTNYIHVSLDPDPEFTVDATVDCNLNHVFNFTSSTLMVNSWLWNFGDGTTSTLENPSHTYSTAGYYNVTLTTTNLNGCSNSVTFYDYIMIAVPQTPIFTADTTKGCFPLNVTFTPNTYRAVSWQWNFGDGNSSVEQIPSHIYQNSGNYNVSLTITTDNNCTYTTTSPSFITLANKAIANFSLSNINNCAPLNIQFTNLSTNAASQLWDFGDGHTSTLQNPSHIYIQPMVPIQ